MRDEVHYRHADLGPAATGWRQNGELAGNVAESNAARRPTSVQRLRERCLLLEGSMEAKMLLVRVLVPPIWVYAMHAGGSGPCYCWLLNMRMYHQRENRSVQ